MWSDYRLRHCSPSYSVSFVSARRNREEDAELDGLDFRSSQAIEK